MEISMRKIAVAATVLFMLLPVALLARETPGAWLRVEKVDGAVVEGELLKVSGRTLYLFDRQSRHGGEVSLDEVLRLDVRRKRSALNGMAIGVTAGLVASPLLGKVVGGDDDSDAEMATFMFWVVSVPVGMLVGGLIGGLRKPYREMIDGGFQEEDRDDILADLRSLSHEGRNDASGG